MKDNLRNGTFSSSQVWKLMSKDKAGTGVGAPFKSYLKQVSYEIILGRAINKDTNPKPCTWGDLVEHHVFGLLEDILYKHVSNDRLFHPENQYWTGAPDLISPKTVSDVKTPYSLEVFCDKIITLQDAFDNEDISVYKRDYPEDYWQHISNAILLELNGTPISHFEAIIYVPYKSELEAIRELANNWSGDQNKVAWINWASDDDLPYLVDGGHFQNLNTFRFPVPEADKQALKERMELATNQLTQIINSNVKNDLRVAVSN